ncbi:MAG: undecaprenyldiphospho-muramoylpentapeptide beta-N-acetylglucosaminyltransferase [Microbacteriaceae bacterium]|nr:undecaprenyldiphospho-muramoylpentapeptide beta-N-acetylglucosaminyltransferase [Microbacteriaceae bacterium]
MIGYYVHHRGVGHLNRALAVIDHLDGPVTILSSAPRPVGYAGTWVALPLDHADREGSEPTANGALHWAPLRSPGLAARMALISQWLAATRPDAVVVDVSVEVALLVRLHGVPVVTIAQPGDRTDYAHTLGFRAANAIIAMWPSGNDALEVAPDVAPRVETVGAISRIPVARPGESTLRHPDRIAVLGGRGTRGESALARVISHARAALPDKDWVVLDNADASTVAHALRTSAVVFAHCGQNAIAEIAASRAPAVFVPEDRPHDEQRVQAAAFARGDHPATVVDGELPDDWAALLRDTAALDGGRWARWCDGGATARAASIIDRVAATGRLGA